MVSIVTMLLTGRSVVQIPAGEREFPVFQNAWIGSGAHPVFYLVSTRVLPWDYRGWSMKLTNDILLVLRLRCIKFFDICYFNSHIISLCVLMNILIGNVSVLINRLLGMHYTQCACWFNL